MRHSLVEGRQHLTGGREKGSEASLPMFPTAVDWLPLWVYLS